MSWIRILEVETGEAVVYEDLDTTLPRDEYLWLEGNFSCDCNRERFFRRAKGEDQYMATSCGEERYLVWIDGEAMQ